MNSKVRLEHVEKALAARDPQFVSLLIEVAKANPDPNLPPLPEGTYTFNNFRSEITSPKFFSQPREVQQSFRTEKLAILDSLDSKQFDQPHLDRYRSHELIYKLWQSDGSFERNCLIQIIRKIPLVYGPWKALKRIFKEAEAVHDTEILAALSHRFDTGQTNSSTEVSKRTLKYLSRRSWRFLRTLAKDTPGCYPDAAADFLAEYKLHQQWAYRTSWVWNHIFFHGESKFGRTSFHGYFHNSDPLKHRAFGDLWKRSPLPLFSLLERSRSELVRDYAIKALKKDFRNVLRDVESDWVIRLLASEHQSVQTFAVWVLENVPKFEQSKFREIGLHEPVLNLLNSGFNEPLIYAAAYARTHARDLPVRELIRLANHTKSKLYHDDKGSAAVRKLAIDLLRTLDPRKDVGLQNWGLLLETTEGSTFAQKMLREHFGAKDLTPEWFAERLLSNSKIVQTFAIERVLDVHPAKQLGEQYFFELLLKTEHRTHNNVLKFATEQLEKSNLDELDIKWLEQLLLHPNVCYYITNWAQTGKLSANRFDPEFLKSIAFHPTFDQTPQVIEAKKQPWGEHLKYNEKVAENIFMWLSDIRLFTPDQIGFQWLMELVARGEPSYHEFAVETMNKAFLPADFAEQAEPVAEKAKGKGKKKAKSEEISIDFEQATFVFTGKLATMTRGEAQKKVESANGKNVGTVSKNLSYLVIGDEGSPMYGQGRKGSKQVKAESLVESGADVKVISETAFLQMLSGTKREFSEDSVHDGCENLWKMLTESKKENSPLARFALTYLRLHHPEICLEETDRPVDPGSEIPDSFLTFERVKPLLLSSRISLRNFGLELAKWEFARWAPKLDDLIELCESPYPPVSDFVTEALLAEDTPQTRRIRLDPESFTTDAVYEYCQSRDQQVRSLGMKLINRQPRLREPEQLFKLTESPDRAVRAFVIRAFWSLYRDRGTTPDWKPTPTEQPTVKKKKKKAADTDTVDRVGPGSPERPENPPAEYADLQFLLRRMLFEIAPGRPPRTTGPSLANVKLKPIPTRKGKMLLVETLRDLAIEDESFAQVVLPVLIEFMNSQGMSEHDSCLVAVARIEFAHPQLRSEHWRDPLEPTLESNGESTKEGVSA